MDESQHSYLIVHQLYDNRLYKCLAIVISRHEELGALVWRKKEARSARSRIKISEGGKPATMTQHATRRAIDYQIAEMRRELSPVEASADGLRRPVSRQKEPWAERLAKDCSYGKAHHRATIFFQVLYSVITLIY